MHKFTVVIVIALTVFSIVEISSTHQESDKPHENEEDDDFSSFSVKEEVEPDAQEELEIRDGDAGPLKGHSYTLPIDMPPINFAFCVSCGYRNAFEQYSQLLKEKYPGVQIEGGNYPPSYPKALGAQIIGLGKIVVIVCIILGKDPFPALGMQTPGFFNWMLGNKLSACMMLFIFSNSIENMLMSTGAFEIYVGKELVWSKLESGRVPSPAELVQSINGYISMHGGKAVNQEFGFQEN
ncbi:unnamed protein product [Bursaphelenchus xylophilus]|uniref:(pine wood nematode) hypothetical protein n=1 Tax=Bursaphelenchus xylophilus TaxID=6326 RepID=A0A1I7RRC5_BURXY|nr:unnamed protein product [Bursaphelenchus xylophilus]CAG9130938.1 unnamed protein product [Bursaphelenchus xylophilus]